LGPGVELGPGSTAAEAWTSNGRAGDWKHRFAVSRYGSGGSALGNGGSLSSVRQWFGSRGPDGARWRTNLIQLGGAGWRLIRCGVRATRRASVHCPTGGGPGLSRPILDDVEVDGFRLGMITDWETQPDVCGDAFVVAPDGSQAGLVWEVIEPPCFQEVMGPW